jgi:hypothetical protein
MRYLTNTLFALAALLMALSFASCGITEDESNCVEYQIIPKLYDSYGNLVPSSAAQKMKAYLYIDGKMFREVEPDANGNYHIRFEQGANVNFVCMAYSPSDSATVKLPAVGDSYNAVAETLAKSAANGNNYNAPAFYYGSQTFNSNLSHDVVLPLRDQRSKIHVAVKGVPAGGKYTVVISGFNSTVGADGTISGEKISYTSELTLDANGYWISDIFSTLPSKDLVVTIYKDGKEFGTVTTNSDGSNIGVDNGDDKVVVIDLKQGDFIHNIFITVMPWADFISQEVII